jgi:hypothetical protein
MSVGFDWRPETLKRGMLDARKATEFDPNYALAHAILAMILSWRSVSGWADDFQAERDESAREADKAAKLGYDNAEALWMVIDAHWATSPKRSVVLYERSIARQPDFSGRAICLGPRWCCLCKDRARRRGYRAD